MNLDVSHPLRDEDGCIRRADLCAIFQCQDCPSLVIPERGEILFCTCPCHSEAQEMLPPEWRPTF